MIQAKELRVGNYVMRNGKTVTVWELCIDEDRGRINYISESLYDPIPLTPELLVKAGVKEVAPNVWSIDSLIMQFKDEVLLAIIDRGVKLPYLHQLQNLYFALTGEELNVKF